MSIKTVPKPKSRPEQMIRCWLCKEIAPQNSCVCNCDVHRQCLEKLIFNLLQDQKNRLEIKRMKKDYALYEIPCPACKLPLQIQVGLIEDEEEQKCCQGSVYPLIGLLTFLVSGMAVALCIIGSRVIFEIEPSNLEEGQKIGIVVGLCIFCFILILDSLYLMEKSRKAHVSSKNFSLFSSAEKSQFNMEELEKKEWLKRMEPVEYSFQKSKKIPAKILAPLEAVKKIEKEEVVGEKVGSSMFENDGKKQKQEEETIHLYLDSKFGRNFKMRQSVKERARKVS